MAESTLPEFLKQGSRARLIPVLADTSRENRATSVFLASLVAVHEFGNRLLGSIGQRVGARSNIRCFTEVILANEFEKRDRPDGLIVIEVGKRKWTALVEAKIGNTNLDPEQIERYLGLAKANKIDAVITISNQLAALPTHHPIRLAKSKTRGLQVFHWSWMHILTNAVLILDTEDVLDKDQRFILEEMIRYFSHESSGIQRFDTMNREWKELTLRVKSGVRLAKNSDEVINTVGAWHQKQRDLCLLLTRRLSTPVSLKISNAHKKDPEKRLRDDCEDLAKTSKLDVDIDIPDASSPLNISVDLMRRTVTCRMQVTAPGDKKSAKARINWLLRQISDCETAGVLIRAVWPNRTSNTAATLEKVRENYEVLLTANRRLSPLRFEVLAVTDLAGKFSARKKFIEELEKAVPSFYEEAGEHLQNWIAPPPKLKEEARTSVVSEIGLDHAPDPIPSPTRRSLPWRR